MRTIRLTVVLLLVALSGCAIKIRPTTVTVGDTPEAKACWRECSQTTTICVGTCRGSLIDYWTVKRCMVACADTRDHCLRTCPGATDSQDQTANPGKQ